MSKANFRPRWMRDLERFLPLKPSFLLSGNVTDYQVVDLDGVTMPLIMTETLMEVLNRNGYGAVLVYDPANGFQSDSDDVTAVVQKLGGAIENGCARMGTAALAAALARFYDLREPLPVALIVNFAGRTMLQPDRLDRAENDLFTRALVGSYAAQRNLYPDREGPFFNTVIWIVDREGDVPDWMVVNNACLRHIPVARPDAQARRAIAPNLLRALGGECDIEVVDHFVDGTEGMLLRDMQSIVQLGLNESVGHDRIRDAVRHFKVGVVDDPWKKIDRRKISNAEEFIRRRVKGQDGAVTHILDVVKRAMTGVGRAKRGRRPRGFAMFAGPTGVGKTELAKTVTELLFGDENSYIRFDMSEFGTEHSDQRLVGAPPGYVGYDQGGQLTNAIREKPHAVVLFDEIEKAHPKLLNLFLQILDDGVLTSGRGDRVYFSEALIIFTSNLGITKTGRDGERIENVTLEDDYATVEKNVRSEIDRHFKFTLGRPEILNRFGENIIVFDFIREKVGGQIFESMFESLLGGMADDGIGIEVAEDVRAALRQVCLLDLSNGGRGIRNQLEAHFVNPLSRAVFDSGYSAGASVRVTAIDLADVTSITLESAE